MNFALERNKGHRTQSCEVLASLVPMVTGDLFHYFDKYKQHFLIVIWQCSLFAIRGLLFELVFDTVAPKSAETSPFTPVGAGHSNNRYITPASTAAAGMCFPRAGYSISHSSSMNV